MRAPLPAGAGGQVPETGEGRRESVPERPSWCRGAPRRGGSIFRSRPWDGGRLRWTEHLTGTAPVAAASVGQVPPPLVMVPAATILPDAPARRPEGGFGEAQRGFVRPLTAVVPTVIVGPRVDGDRSLEVQIGPAGPERLEDFGRLWRSVQEHHAQVAPQLTAVRPFRTADASWEVRRPHYVAWLAERDTFALVAEHDGAT